MQCRVQGIFHDPDVYRFHQLERKQRVGTVPCPGADHVPEDFAALDQLHPVAGNTDIIITMTQHHDAVTAWKQTVQSHDRLRLQRQVR